MNKPIICFQDLKFLLIFIVFQLLFFSDAYKNVEGVIPGVTNPRPAGHLWPAKAFKVAR